MYDYYVYKEAAHHFNTAAKLLGLQVELTGIHLSHCLLCGSKVKFK